MIEARGTLGPRGRERACHGLAVHVENERVSGGPLLCGEDSPNVRLVEPTRPEAVDGLGRERDEPAAREDERGLGDHRRLRARGRHAEHSGHGAGA